MSTERGNEVQPGEKNEVTVRGRQRTWPRIVPLPSLPLSLLLCSHLQAHCSPICSPAPCGPSAACKHTTAQLIVIHGPPPKILITLFCGTGMSLRWMRCDFSNIYPVPKQPKHTSPTVKVNTTSVKSSERIKCSFSTCQSKIASFTINQPAILKQYYENKISAISL